MSNVDFFFVSDTSVFDNQSSKRTSERREDGNDKSKQKEHLRLRHLYAWQMIRQEPNKISSRAEQNLIKSR